MVTSLNRICETDRAASICINMLAVVSEGQPSKVEMKMTRMGKLLNDM